MATVTLGPCGAKGNAVLKGLDSTLVHHQVGFGVRITVAVELVDLSVPALPVSLG